MKRFIQTRGKAVDYRFLGHSPDRPWWHDFRSWTSFEKPTLLVTSRNGCWRLYLSGIPSARLDRVNTTIRYTMVLEGAARDPINEEASKVAAAWVADAASPAEDSVLQRALDEVLPEELVERLLHDRSDDAASEAAKQLQLAIGRLPPAIRPAQSDPGAWIGALRAETCRTKFLYRVDTLLNGGSGEALMVNLVGDEKEAKNILLNKKETSSILLDRIAILLVDPNLSFLADRERPLKFVNPDPLLPIEHADSDEKKKKRNHFNSKEKTSGNESFFTKIQTSNGLFKAMWIVGAFALLALGLYYFYEMRPQRITFPPQTGLLAR